MINVFKGIFNKGNLCFIKFDIVEFYLFIFEKFFDKVIVYVKSKIVVIDDVIVIIKYLRKFFFFD